MSFQAIGCLLPICRNVGQLAEVHHDANRVDQNVSPQNVFRVNEIVIALLDATLSACTALRALPAFVWNMRKVELVLRLAQFFNGSYLLHTLNEKRTNLQTMLNLVNIARIAALFTGISFTFRFGMACLDLSLRGILALNQ